MCIRDRDTGIGGSSMGGLMSLYGVIRHNDIFSRSAAISPSVVNTLQFFKEDIERCRIEPKTHLFLSYGTKENKRDHTEKLKTTIEIISQLCIDKGIDTTFYEHIGGKHNEESWEQETPLWLKAIWGN